MRRPSDSAGQPAHELDESATALRTEQECKYLRRGQFCEYGCTRHVILCHAFARGNCRHRICRRGAHIPSRNLDPANESDGLATAQFRGRHCRYLRSGQVCRYGCTPGPTVRIMCHAFADGRCRDRFCNRGEHTLNTHFGQSGRGLNQEAIPKAEPEAEPEP